MSWWRLLAWRRTAETPCSPRWVRAKCGSWWSVHPPEAVLNAAQALSICLGMSAYLAAWSSLNRSGFPGDAPMVVKSAVGLARGCGVEFPPCAGHLVYAAV